jgi:phosphate:Na+ symporter
MAVAAWAAAPGAEAGAPDIDWLSMGAQLFGGLALFLFGMEQLSRGLKAAAGEQLKDVLARLTRNRVLAAITGAFVTAVLNSSSVTTVLVVGFITAGVISLGQSIGVILGANVGSTFTAQIIAFNVTAIGLPMVALGFLSMTAGSTDRSRYGGEMLMGLGLVFFGMSIMSDGMNPLRSFGPFLDLMARMERPALGILVGAVFTGLVQSSAATMGIAIVMAADGLIGLPAGIALALGANIGTCVTAVLAAIGKPVEAVRAVAAHVLFNVLGVLLWVAFIPEMAEWVRRFSPSEPGLEGVARLAAEVPRQIANAHTFFNVFNSMFFLPFTGVLAAVVVRLVPDREEPERVIAKPRFLDRELLDVPSVALQQVRFELGHVGEKVRSMYSEMLPAIQERSPERFEAITQMGQQVELLSAEVLSFLREVRKRELTYRESEVFTDVIGATAQLEATASVISTDVVALGQKVMELDRRSSETMQAILGAMYDDVSEALGSALSALVSEDERAAQAVLMAQADVRRHQDEALRHQAAAIERDDPETRLRIFRIEMETVEILKRIYGNARRIARTVLPAEITASKV